MAKKPKGWVKEPVRHGLASKGVKTVKTFQTPYAREQQRLGGRIPVVTLEAKGGKVSMANDSSEWPKKFETDGGVYRLSSVWPTRKIAEELVKESRQGKLYNRWGTKGGADVRLARAESKYTTAAGTGLFRPYRARGVGGYEQGRWAVYERRL